MDLDSPYQFLDLDWFFIDVDGHLAHVCSGGGKLPISIAENYPHDFLLTIFRNLPSLGKADINPMLQKYVAFKNNKEREQYLNSFSPMTQRGLYSFDKSDLTRSLDGKYHLVSSPKITLHISMLPPEVVLQLSKTKINRRIKEVDSFDVFEVS
ncbi:MAG TPA: hypothetical protein VIU12_04590 [Chryseolinea sp.]